MKKLLFSIIFIGFILRFLCIVHLNWTNSSDLTNYFWAASRAASGESAYRLWAQNLAGPRADLLPLELFIMSTIVRLWLSPEVLRWFFLIFDLINIVILWNLFRGNRIKQLTWSVLYSFWPSTIYFFTMTPSDKPIIIAGLLSILWLVKRSAPKKSYLLSVFLVGFLAAFKWFGLFIAVPVAYAYSQRRNLRFFIFLIGVALIFVVSHILWFPDWLVVYRFRSMRFGPPFHSSLGVLLQQFGISISSAYLPLMVGSWFLVQVLCLKGYIYPSLAIVLSPLSILIWAPDTTAQMLFMLTLLVLVEVDWDRPLWIAIVFGSTIWMTLMAAAAAGEVIPGLPLVDHLVGLSGPYGGPMLSFWSHFPLMLLIPKIIEAARKDAFPIHTVK